MFNVMIIAADVIYKKAKLKLKKSHNLYNTKKILHIVGCYQDEFLSTKFGKYSLNWLFFTEKYGNH